MRLILTLLCCVIVLSCDNNKKSNKAYLPASNGNLNAISVVVDNDLWEGSVGETIRSIFASAIPGLPVDEPMFSMRQIPTQVFEGFATRSRIVLKIEKQNVDPTTKIVNEAFAKPQTLVVVAGKTSQDITNQLNKSKDKIIDAFTKEEVKEKQRRIKLSLLDDNKMETALGFSIEIPSAYRIAKSEDNFYWIRKNLSNTKTMDLMFYEVPLETINKGDSTIVDIIEQRNTTTKAKIPGEDNIFMTVEDAYAPSMFETIIDNKKSYEVRGVWEVKGQYMAGPFITYAIRDDVNKRFLIADGYVYAPSLEKRDYIFELESIIKSIRIL